MSNFKTVSDFVKESGMSLPTVSGLLKDVKPEVVLGRTKGYHPDSLRAALINKHIALLKYLNLDEIAATSMAGYGAE